MIWPNLVTFPQHPPFSTLHTFRHAVILAQVYGAARKKKSKRRVPPRVPTALIRLYPAVAGACTALLASAQLERDKTFVALTRSSAETSAVLSWRAMRSACEFYFLHKGDTKSTYSSSTLLQMRSVCVHCIRTTCSCIFNSETAAEPNTLYR